MLQIGDIRIHVINDGDTWVDPGGAFGLVPRVLWSRYFEPNENHLVPMVEMCLLVQTGDYNIVVDTGLGTKLSEKQQRIWHLSRPRGDLLAALERMGVTPEDVTHVIDTHLHADHCSGNTRFADDGATIVPTFPNAEYVVQRREYQDAINPNERTAATYLSDNWQALVDYGQMRLLDGDTEIAPGVWGVVTPGHTPGHMSVRFQSKGHYAAYLCDLASYAAHFERLGWMTAYDVEPLVTLETKRRWQQWALETDAVLIFGHDPQRPVGRLKPSEGNRPPRVESIDEPFA
jgi:glyoxylase-like metal-dependent hydrolase (beta-lactamase superfamily II)